MKVNAFFCNADQTTVKSSCIVLHKALVFQISLCEGQGTTDLFTMLHMYNVSMHIPFNVQLYSHVSTKALRTVYFTCTHTQLKNAVQLISYPFLFACQSMARIDLHIWAKYTDCSCMAHLIAG